MLQCQRAGVIVRMVTGDHPGTAKYIAKECAILTSDKHLVMVTVLGPRSGAPWAPEQVLTASADRR